MLRVSSDAALSIRARTWCGKYAASEDLCTCDIPFAKVKQKSLDLHPSLLRLRERDALSIGTFESISCSSVDFLHARFALLRLVEFVIRLCEN